MGNWVVVFLPASLIRRTVLHSLVLIVKSSKRSLDAILFLIISHTHTHTRLSRQFLQFPCTILHVRCPLCLISSSVCLVAWLQCSKAGLDSASLRRRVPFIYFFLCPVCSLFASECIFWLIVACRGVHEEMKITVNTWQQAAAYLLLSFVTLAAIMLVCFSSIDVPGAEATVAVEGQWMDRTLTASHSFS